MPYLAHLTVKLTRKFQLGKDDWLGVDALATVAVEEAEAHLVDPAEVRRMAREQAKLAVAEQIADELAEREALRAERAAARNGSLAPVDNGHTTEPPPPPRTVEEAERRFYARWGDVIGGDSWADVQRFAGIRSRPPTTIKQWYAVAEAVHRRAQAGR